MKRVIAAPIMLMAAACVAHPTPYVVPDISLTGRSLAQTTEEGSGIDLLSPLKTGTLADMAVLNNPDLVAMRTEAGLADAQVFAAGLLPDPAISLGADFPLNGAHEVTALAASLGLDLAALSTRPGRIEAAEAQASGIRKDILWAEWLTRQNAKLLATRIAWLDTIKLKTAEYRSLADSDLRRAIAAASRGDIAAIEVDARRLAAADASDRDRSAENQLASARLDLNRLLGIAPGEFVAVEPPASMSDKDWSGNKLFEAALQYRSDLQGLRDGLHASNAGISVADASRFPLPSISLNAGRDTGSIRTLGPAVTFTLPVWNRARGELAIAKASRTVLESQYRARCETVRADIGAALTALEIANRQYSDVARDLAGISDQADRAAAAANRGDISDTSAAATRLTALDKEILADTLSLAAAEAAIALETATGRPLDTF